MYNVKVFPCKVVSLDWNYFHFWKVGKIIKASKVSKKRELYDAVG